MCQSCVNVHLLRIIHNVKTQLSAGGGGKPTCLKLCFEPCVPCRPFDINPKAMNTRKRVFYFPGISDQETATFTILLRLCGLLVDNLTTGKVATIRDLYYQDVALFHTQNNVVRALNRITKLILVPRVWLNVLPSPNGLVTGNLTIAMEGGDILEVLRSNGPSLIPAASVMYVSASRTPRFLLVVEKEAVFTHLQNELPEGVIITGRGFPDHATRRLVKMLTITYPDMPVFGLFDSDPHGILILRNYENGSDQNVEQQEYLQMIYLGVSLLEYSEGLVGLTPNDIRVSMSTLQKPWIYEPRYNACKTELQRGLFMHQKGEMNLLDGNKSQRLSNYVHEKINQILPAFRSEHISTNTTSSTTKTASPKLNRHDLQQDQTCANLKHSVKSKILKRKRRPRMSYASLRTPFSKQSCSRNNINAGFENLSSDDISNDNKSLLEVKTTVHF